MPAQEELGKQIRRCPECNYDMLVAFDRKTRFDHLVVWECQKILKHDRNRAVYRMESQTFTQ